MNTIKKKFFVKNWKINNWDLEFEKKVYFCNQFAMVYFYGFGI